jgi:tetratricopeptide (TPR) repeat protein
MNNIHGQCLFNQGSFPTEFHYNVIGSTVTNEFPYIKAVEYDEIKIDTTSNPDWEGDPEFEVQNNCWILNNVNDTNPEDNLVPDGAYEWRNVWCPGSSGTAEEKQGEALYYSALSNIESQNYSTAESKFKQVIETYPSSKYAQASLKGLYGLNPNLNDSSYSNLKSYCDSLALNPGDSVLGKSAEWIAIHCDIKDEEYQDAIDALDSIIINPGSYADSIFAIIDLDYVYSKAGDSSLLKTSLTTSHQHLISYSNTQFRKNRFLRIEELIKPTKVQPKNDKPYGEIIDENQPLSILSIFPNPARNEISIKYKVNGKGKVILKLYSSQGRMIDSKFLGRMNPGTYETNLSLASFTKGMYFVILAKDDVLVDSRKVLKVD